MVNIGAQVVHMNGLQAKGMQRLEEEVEIDNGSLHFTNIVNS